MRFSSGSSPLAVALVGACTAWAGPVAHAQESPRELPESLLMGDTTRPLYEEDGRIWWLGAQVFFARDGLAPTETAATDTTYGSGIGLAIPVTMDVWKGLGMRLHFSTTYSANPPFNMATTYISYTIPADEETGTPPQNLTRSLEAYFINAQLGVGLNYGHPIMEGTLVPYGGLGPAFLLVAVFSDLTSEDAVLLLNQYNDINDSNNIDPYSINLVPGFNAWVGTHIRMTRTLHLGIEATLTRATVPETELDKSTDGFDARRFGFPYGAATFSTGLIWHF